MKIIGFNLAKNSYGLPLDNGGVCLIVDGRVQMMVNEERLNRTQYSPGLKMSLDYILSSNNLSIKDIDKFVASACLDVLPSVDFVHGQLAEYGFKVPKSKITVCDHHMSHAYSAYYPSGFNQAIVMVIDGDGNVVGDKMKSGTNNKKKYWDNELDHNSYYIAKGDEIKFLEKDQIGPKQNGFGGAYRYFTYFCGFPGYKYAGKLMGLSAYGSARNKYKNVKLFDLLPNGQVKCLLADSDRLKSPQVVQKWLAKHGINIEPRNPDSDPNKKISNAIEDASFLMQRELDRALIHKVNYLVQKTGIKKLCIAGGVGLNAVSNRAILDNTDIEEIFIQPACGDSGQPLGNAYYGVQKFDKKHLKREPISVYQGKEYSDEEILEALEFAAEPIKCTKMPVEKLVELAATKVQQNNIVGWFQGRSEIGPRALGNRSIVANPINPKMKDIINLKVKHREYFRPFAPSVLEEEVSKWFDIDIRAPYMILNAQVKQPKKIPSITHFDGSARLQTVSKKDNPRYHALISAFAKKTSVPVIINTSLNDNESIVETPRDVVNLFLRTGIDYLFVGDYFVEKDMSLDSRTKAMKAIENEWSKIAATTDKIQNAKSKVLDQKILKTIKKYAKKGASVFDYNCEWGEYAGLLADNGYKVTAHNISDEMLESAKHKFKKVNFVSKKELIKKLHTLENRFDVVLSNLWLCILPQAKHEDFLKNLKKLVTHDGKIVLSFCHPCFDTMKESIVTHRMLPEKRGDYHQELKHRKIVHENGLDFIDYHRPLNYYTALFRKNNLRIVDILESEILGTNFYPDFIIFVLEKEKNVQK